MLAEAGNGLYQTITTNDADIQNLLVTVDKPVQQQGKENDNVLLDQWAEKGPWLLLLVLPLAALTFRKGLLCFALLLILPLPKNSYALGWQDLWQTKDQQAQQAYKKQDFATAAEQFENPDWKVASQYKAGDYEKAVENLKTVSNAYNQGNVLAKAGKLEEAIKAYEKALEINPNDSDAKFNKELVEKELDKQKQEKKQDQKKDNKQQEKDKSQQNKEGDKKDGEQSEKSGEQQKSEEKPEQKPEQKQSDKEQAPENQQQDKAEQKKPEEAKAEQAEQKNEPTKDESAKEQAPANIQPSDEKQQANEQWLKRIPDDPAGLLKRKFKYQYGQRGRQTDGNTGGW
jgi:Ca-activated chloride channel family protein